MPSYRKFQRHGKEPKPRSPCRWRCKAKKDIRRGDVDFFNNLSIPPPIPSWTQRVSQPPKAWPGAETGNVRASSCRSASRTSVPGDRSGHHLHSGPEEPYYVRRQGHGPGTARDIGQLQSDGLRVVREKADDKTRGGEQAAASPSQDADSTGAATDAHLFGALPASRRPRRRAGVKGKDF